MILPHSGFSSWTILLTHSTIREKSTQQQQRRGQRRRRRRKEEFYFSSGSNLIVSPVLWRSFELHSWFPLQKWSFCGQGVSNHSWLSASHFLTRPFFCLDGTPVYPKYYYSMVVQPVSSASHLLAKNFFFRARPRPTQTYGSSILLHLRFVAQQGGDKGIIVAIRVFQRCYPKEKPYSSLVLFLVMIIRPNSPTT